MALQGSTALLAHHGGTQRAAALAAARLRSSSLGAAADELDALERERTNAITAALVSTVDAKRAQYIDIVMKALNAAYTREAVGSSDEVVVALRAHTDALKSHHALAAEILCAGNADDGTIAHSSVSSLIAPSDDHRRSVDAEAEQKQPLVSKRPDHDTQVVDLERAGMSTDVLRALSDAEVDELWCSFFDRADDAMKAGAEDAATGAANAAAMIAAPPKETMQSDLLEAGMTEAVLQMLSQPEAARLWGVLCASASSEGVDAPEVAQALETLGIGAHVRGRDNAQPAAALPDPARRKLDALAKQAEVTIAARRRADAVKRAEPPPPREPRAPQGASRQSAVSGAGGDSYPRILFTNAAVEPTHEGELLGMELKERAGIETAEQAVMAVRMAQARGFSILPPEERSPVPLTAGMPRAQSTAASSILREHEARVAAAKPRAREQSQAGVGTASSATSAAKATSASAGAATQPHAPAAEPETWTAAANSAMETFSKWWTGK